MRLPWAPKVRQKDIDQFLYDSRNKFIGYSFAGDHESLAGLPQPIHEGYNILRRVSYKFSTHDKYVRIIKLIKNGLFTAYVHKFVGHSNQTRRRNCTESIDQYRARCSVDTIRDIISSHSTKFATMHDCATENFIGCIPHIKS